MNAVFMAAGAGRAAGSAIRWPQCRGGLFFSLLVAARGKGFQSGRLATCSSRALPGHASRRAGPAARVADNYQVAPVSHPSHDEKQSEGGDAVWRKQAGGRPATPLTRSRRSDDLPKGHADPSGVSVFKIYAKIADAVLSRNDSHCVNLS